MINLSFRRTVLATACLCLVVVAGPTHVLAAESKQVPAHQPANELNARCIGRYLIDLPTDLVLTAHGGQRIDGVTLSVKPATLDEYRKTLAQRTAELNAGVVSRADAQYPLLRKATPLPVATAGMLFDAAEPDSVAGRTGRKLEVLAWRDGYLIKAQLDAADTTFPEEKDNATLHAHVKSDVAQKTSLLLDVVARTSGRADPDIPTQQGTCIINGFVRGAPTAGESITGMYEFAKIEHFFLRIQSTSLSRGKNTILDRIEKTRPLIESAKGKVFRKNKRNVDGMNGYEVAYSMPNDKDQELKNVMTDQFIFELNSAEGSKRKPRLIVEGHNGVLLRDYPEKDEGAEPVTSAARLRGMPLSTSSLERMWDQIIPTIRARPGAF